MRSTWGIDFAIRTASAAIDRLARAHQRRRTIRALEALPLSVLKDIGFPGDYLEPRGNRRR